MADKVVVRKNLATVGRVQASRGMQDVGVVAKGREAKVQISLVREVSPEKEHEVKGRISPVQEAKKAIQI